MTRAFLILVSTLTAFAAQAETIVDQRSPDITVLSAEVTPTVLDHNVFNAEKCKRPDGVVDCTWKLEQLTGRPAIITAHDPGQYTSYYCHATRVVTVSRKAAIEAASAIGFFVSNGQGLVIPRRSLKKIGEATLKNGEAAELHEFTGIAHCWQGSSSSSNYATYRFRPFIRFENAGVAYHNWDQVPSDYVLSVSVVEKFDRSAELLR